MSSSIVRLVNGGTIAVREGVLRGVGPEGPSGPQGPPGTATTIRGRVANQASLPSVGTQGDGYIADDTGYLWVWQADLVPPRFENAGKIVGPAGDLQSPGASFLYSTTQTVPGTSWQTLTFGASTTFTYNDVQVLTTGNLSVCTKVNSTQFKVNHPVSGSTGMYLMTAEVTYTNGAGSVAGDRTIGWFKNGTLQRSQQVYDAGNDGSTGNASITRQFQTNSSDLWTVGWLANDTANSSVNSVRITISRIGGGIGPTGPQGIQGAVGPAGPQGLTGSAGGGYATMDALTGSGFDADADPGGTYGATTEQGFPYPTGAQRPHIPWFMKKLVETLERYVVARLDTPFHIQSRTNVDPGEFFYSKSLSSTGGRGLYVVTANSPLTIEKVAMVQMGTTDISGTAPAANGVIYLKHEA